jgi:hypothetical protein
MFGVGWQEFGVFLSAGFYVFLLGGVIYLGYRTIRGAERREQNDLARNQAALVAQVKQEVLADLDIARRAEAAASASPPTSRRSNETMRDERA